MTVPTSRSLPDPVAAAIESWVGHHDRLAPGVVEGLYVVGSVALDDWTPRSDIDVVAFISDPTDPDTVTALEAAHVAYRSEGGHPTVDGPFLSWADVASPPTSLQRPWSLDGEFRFDAECFELNPVVWYTLAEYGVAVRGPATTDLGVACDEADRRAWVRDNVDTYWRTVREEVAGVLAADPDRQEFSADMVEWCVLGVARIWLTAETGGVVSKTEAGAWAARRLPDHADVFATAAAVRAGDAGATVGRDTVEAVVDAMGAMIDAIV